MEMGQKNSKKVFEILENEKMIIKNSTTKWTSITIVNWELYQFREQQIPQQIPQQSPQQSPIKMDTNKNVKNNKENNEQKNILLEHFELIWKIYPNKKGKAKALEYYLQWIKGRKIANVTRKITDKQMYYAVQRYAKECEDNNTEVKFIKHGDSFFNKAILDYVEEENE